MDGSGRLRRVGAEGKALPPRLLSAYQLSRFGFELLSAGLELRWARIGGPLPQIRYCLGRPLQPANEQLVASDHQRGKVIVAPVTDDEPSVFPVPHNGRPRSALAEIQQTPIFFFYRFRAHRSRKLSRHRSISTHAVHTTWVGCTHIERSSATTTVIVGNPFAQPRVGATRLLSTEKTDQTSRGTCSRSTK